MTIKPLFFLLALWLPMISYAQPVNEAKLIKQAIHEYFKQSQSPVQWQVKNIRIDQARSTADITAKDSESAMVCLKKDNNKWRVVNVGSSFGPGDCD